MKFAKLAALLPLFLTAEAGVLFGDSFDRPDSRDIQAVPDGITDGTGDKLPAGGVYSQPFLDPNSRAPAHGIQDEVPDNGGGSRILAQRLQLAVGKGTSNAFLNHNFTDAAITAAGGFAVSIDVAAYTQTGAGQGGGFAVGMSRADASATGDAAQGTRRMTGGFGTRIGDAVPAAVASDFWLAIRGNSTLVWGGRSGEIAGVSGLPAKTGKISAVFGVSGFGAGTKVGYQVFLNDAEQGRGSFSWSADNSNFIGIDCRDAECVTFDNFAIRTATQQPQAAVEASPSPVQPPAAHAASRPNIIVILADDLGWSDLGCYGSEIPTPNLDALAAEGVRFRSFYNSARCSPTRCSLLSGLYPQQAAVKPAAPLPDLRNDNNVTFAELLGSEGYRTYMSGKWHLGNGPLLPENRGFQHAFRFANGGAHSTDNWKQDNYRLLSQKNEIPFRDYTANGGTFYQTDAIGDYAVDFINHSLAKKDDTPFALYMAFGAPHFPLQAPAALVDRYMPVYNKGWDVLRRERYDRQLAKGVIDKRYPFPDRGGAGPHQKEQVVEIPAWTSLDSDRRADLARRMALYAAMVQKLDENVGKVVARLKETKQFDNSLIFFMSDNGGNHEGGVFGAAGRGMFTGDAVATMGQPGQDGVVQYGGGWAHLSNTPLKLFKHFTHEGGIRAPLIVHWPAGFPARDTWVETPVHLVDVMGSIIEAAGAKYPASFKGHPVLPAEGISLLPAIRKMPVAERALFVEHESNRMVRKGKWKLVTESFTAFDSEFTGGQRLLFDMDADPGEANDLAARHPEKVAELSQEWNAWSTRVGLPSGRLIGSEPGLKAGKVR